MVVASNTLTSMLPNEFQELDGSMSVSESSNANRVIVDVEFDRVVDIYRGGLKTSFDALERDGDTLHVEFVVNTKDAIPDLDYRIDMRL